MESEERLHLEKLMAQMADDRGFVVPFIEAFGERLAATVRWHLRELGREDVAHDREEFDGLIFETAFFIAENAAAWRPDAGAMPWTWAQRGIRAVISKQVGPRVVRSDEGLDSEVSDTAPGCALHLGADDIETLAQTNPTVDLVCRVVFEVANPRDAAVFLMFRCLKREGAHSPATTVVKAFPHERLSAANARQIHSRVGRQVTERLKDPTYQAIADLPFWAA